MNTFLAAMTTDGWRPGIGDPGTLGWVTTVAYLVASFTCVGAWWRERHDPTAAPKFWLLLFLAMFLLGINKQLDLQSWFTWEGRKLAQSEGWYEHRKPVQAAFVGVVGLIGLVSVAAVLWLLRGRVRRYRVALAGLVYTTSFVVIRAASFHHIDRLLHVGLEHIRLNHILELSGIAFVAVGAVQAIVRRPLKESGPITR